MNTIYPVNEIFESIQGEASFTGTPAIFIRMQGCPVGCHWCDTKHTWDLKNPIPIVDMLNKQNDQANHAPMTAKEILKCLEVYKAKHIVITGGEPATNDLKQLTQTLILEDYSVQIETSGTFWVSCRPECFITVSPKVDMFGGYEILDEVLEMADEIKMPVGKLKDVEILKDLLKKTTCDNIWLQPLSTNKRATEICINEATLYNWKISIQTHKFIGVR